MKKTITFLVLVCLLFPCHSQNLLNNPESIVYDSVYDRYLVSNCGDGQIVQIDSNGMQSYFNTDLSNTLGLHIVGDTLFVSSNSGPYSGIVGFLLASGEIVFHVNITEKQLLNDIASDQSGNLYVTDCDANKIFKVHMNSQTYTTLIDDGLGYPNGILFDEQNNRLIVLNCLLSWQPILSVSLDDLSVSTIVETGIHSIDGLTEDNYGNYYFSSWSTDRVYRYDPSFTNPPEIIAGGYTDPADIYYNKLDNVLAIPNFNADTIIFLPFNPVRIDDSENEKTGYIHVYPNPFSGMFNISSELLMTSGTVTSVYDMNGRLVNSSHSETIYLSENTICFDGSQLQAGVYIVNVRSAKEEQYCKIVKR